MIQLNKNLIMIMSIIIFDKRIIYFFLIRIDQHSSSIESPKEFTQPDTGFFILFF